MLIFAQLRGVLDLVESDVLRPLGVSHLRIDGGVEAGERFRRVQAFNADPTLGVMLLTTSVGGLGLNLTSADTVVFLEHDWNPMKDLQVGGPSLFSVCIRVRACVRVCVLRVWGGGALVAFQAESGNQCMALDTDLLSGKSAPWHLLCCVCQGVARCAAAGDGPCAPAGSAAHGQRVPPPGSRYAGRGGDEPAALQARGGRCSRQPGECQPGFHGHGRTARHLWRWDIRGSSE
jgi:hypothetical protein